MWWFVLFCFYLDLKRPKLIDYQIVIHSFSLLTDKTNHFSATFQKKKIKANRKLP